MDKVGVWSKGIILVCGADKRQMRIEKRLNYNVGDNKSHVPKCPPEKEKAIMETFRHFNMI